MHEAKQQAVLTQKQDLNPDEFGAVEAVRKAMAAVQEAVKAVSAAMPPMAVVEANHREHGPHPFPLLLAAREKLTEAGGLLQALEVTGLRVGPEVLQGHGVLYRASAADVFDQRLGAMAGTALGAGVPSQR